MDKTLVITTLKNEAGELASFTYYWAEKEVKSTRVFITANMSDQERKKILFINGVEFKDVAQKLVSLLTNAKLIFFDSNDQVNVLDKAFRENRIKYDWTNNIIVDIKSACEKTFDKNLSNYYRFFKNDTDYKNENQDQNSDTVALNSLYNLFSKNGTCQAIKLFEVDNDGDVVYNFGKYKNEKVKEFYDYAKWIINKSTMPEYVKNVCREHAKTPRQI